MAPARPFASCVTVDTALSPKKAMFWQLNCLFYAIRMIFLVASTVNIDAIVFSISWLMEIGTFPK
jgi:hypothetical protein